LLQPTGFTLRIQSNANTSCVSDEKVDDGEEGTEHFDDEKGAEHSGNDEVEDPIPPFKIANMGCQNHVYTNILVCCCRAAARL
jgi:hypothetical protein